MLPGRQHWNWIPTLYFTEGIPFIAITLVSLIFYKQMGLSNAEITFYTSWLYLPWVIRPLWRPFQRLAFSRRWWVSTAQLLIGASLGGVAFTISSPLWFQGSQFFFWTIAFAAATHDNITDELYEQNANHDNTHLFLGGRAVFHNLANIVGQGILIMLAGNLQLIYRNSISYSWSIAFYGLAGLTIALWLWNHYTLPNNHRPEHAHAFMPKTMWTDTLHTLRSFFSNPSGKHLLPLLLYCSAYGLLSKVAILFLIDASHNGGLGLAPQEYGFVQGTLGVFALSLGGIAAGLYDKHTDHRYTVRLLLAAILLPPLTYVTLSYTLPGSLAAISCCVVIALFSTGFGSLLYGSLLINQIKNSFFPKDDKTSPSPYTIARATLVLALMVPGIFSGLLQEAIGYRLFFILTLLASGVFLKAALYFNKVE